MLSAEISHSKENPIKAALRREMTRALIVGFLGLGLIYSGTCVKEKADTIFNNLPSSGAGDRRITQLETSRLEVLQHALYLSYIALEITGAATVVSTAAAGLTVFFSAITKKKT